MRGAFYFERTQKKILDKNHRNINTCRIHAAKPYCFDQQIIKITENLFMNSKNKNDKNNILKKYIICKYGSIAKFLKKEKFSPHYLETVLEKSDIFYEIGIGIKICAVLNIDAEKLFCHGKIVELKKSSHDNNDSATENLSLDDIIKAKYAGLSKDERKKVLDFADYIFEEGNGDNSPV